MLKKVQLDVIEQACSGLWGVEVRHVQLQDHCWSSSPKLLETWTGAPEMAAASQLTSSTQWYNWKTNQNIALEQKTDSASGYSVSNSSSSNSFIHLGVPFSLQKKEQCKLKLVIGSANDTASAFVHWIFLPRLVIRCEKWKEIKHFLFLL